MKGKTKKVLIIIGVVIALIAAFLIYWKATEHDRYIKGRIAKIEEEVAACRNGENYRFYFWVSSAEKEDPTYIDFLSTQVSEMIENTEYSILGNFLERLESEEAYIPEVKDDVTALFNGVGDLEVALKIQDELKYLKYYNADFDLSRDSVMIAAYIKTNGIEEITTTPGTGYYANETDRSSNHQVGLEDSPLYDAKGVTYRGDFKITYESGVGLDSHYEETYYSSATYHFRDNYITFSPDDGECVYSGEYLFCFSRGGTLIGIAKISDQ